MLKNAGFRCNQIKACNESRHFDRKRLAKCYLIFKFGSMFGQSVAILLLKSALHRNDKDRPKCGKIYIGKIETSSSFHHNNNTDRIMKTRPKHEALVLLVSDSNNMTSPELGFGRSIIEWFWNMRCLESNLLAFWKN